MMMMMMMMTEEWMVINVQDSLNFKGLSFIPGVYDYKKCSIVI